MFWCEKKKKGVKWDQEKLCLFWGFFFEIGEIAIFPYWLKQSSREGEIVMQQRKNFWIMFLYKWDWDLPHKQKGWLRRNVEISSSGKRAETAVRVCRPSEAGGDWCQMAWVQRSLGKASLLSTSSSQWKGKKDHQLTTAQSEVGGERWEVRDKEKGIVV